MIKLILAGIIGFLILSFISGDLISYIKEKISQKFEEEVLPNPTLQEIKENLRNNPKKLIGMVLLLALALIIIQL